MCLDKASQSCPVLSPPACVAKEEETAAALALAALIPVSQVAGCQSRFSHAGPFTLHQPPSSTISLASLQELAPCIDIWVAKTRADNVLVTSAPRTVPPAAGWAPSLPRLWCVDVKCPPPCPPPPLPSLGELSGTERLRRSRGVKRSLQPRSSRMLVASPHPAKCFRNREKSQCPSRNLHEPGRGKA